MAFRGQNIEGPFSYTAHATAIASNMLVTLGSDGLLVVANANDPGVGYIMEAVAASQADVTVYPREGTTTLTCDVTSIAVGDLVKPGASGTVLPEATVTTRTAATIGRALTAATSGQLFQVHFI
jgi:Uncharacterized conserved protein (DUF2190)